MHRRWRCTPPVRSRSSGRRADGRSGRSGKCGARLKQHLARRIASFTPRLTINAGLRWDYQDAPGISHDRDNIAPRLGVAYALRRDGSLVVRSSYGPFYDQVLFIISSNALRAATVTQTLFSNPGYPDPFGPNPRRSGSINVAVPSTTVLAHDMKTPVTEQATLGMRAMRGSYALTIDGVWARGPGSFARFVVLDMPSAAPSPFAISAR